MAEDQGNRNAGSSFNQYFAYGTQNHQGYSLGTKRTFLRKKPKSIKFVRKWKNVDLEKNFTSKSSGFTFTLACYNILAQTLLEEHNFLYKEHQEDCLYWDRRWNNLNQEVAEINADIFCLQEVEESYLNEYFNQSFSQRGYKSLFKKRTGNKVDGCAIYYKSDVLNLIDFATIEFNQSFNTSVDRDNVAIIAKFSPVILPKAEFIVATTHLLYNPRREDIRIFQTQLLLAELDRLAYKTEVQHENNKETRSYLPIILAGDFNTPPMSPVYELITSGKFIYESINNGTNSKPLFSNLGITDTCQHVDIIDRRKTTGEIKDEKELVRLCHSESAYVPVRKSPPLEHKHLFESGKISHQFALKSVYQHFFKGIREATTFHEEWRTVDYIFYSGQKSKDRIEDDKLKLVSRYILPLVNQLYDVKIPNYELGSDHLLLAARFSIKE